MATKKFNVTVNGTTYEVEVEEVKAAGGAPKAASAPKAAPAPAPAPKAAPAPAAAPKVAAGAGEHSIDAPMPGKVIKLVAAEGAAVKAGDVLLILEAMKMQNEITADADGTVKKFNVTAGQSVKAHESLVILG
ncbi:MAG: biotin/lipoyl-binding protein [Selenomonadaceae bacterium]|nr:biotin/lipoyl-binding protein [Selenomonadaceae bacterium]MBQ4495752.1 biotin/lipoyl-binding protein [Selenomonadaceae bacterium]